MKRISTFRHRGSALVSTLLVIVVLTIIVTAFLQSMTIERQTSYSYLNRYRAEMATQAAVNAAIAQVMHYVSQYPDSVTAWDPNIGSDSNTLPATLLFYYPNSPVLTTTGTLPSPRFVPLVSGATDSDFLPAGGRSATLNYASGKVNINSTKFGFGNNQPWIGIFPPSTPTRDVDSDSKIEVPWVDLTSDEEDSPQAVGRYAYWVEDESFRVNVNTAGNTRRGGNTSGTSANQIPLQGIGDALAKDPASAFGTEFMQKAEDIRSVDSLKSIPTPFAIGQTLENPSYDPATIRFLISVNSSGSNLSRTGAKRLNPNEIVGSKASSDDIQEQLDTITRAIKAQAPAFGQRFWAKANEENPVQEQYADIYLKRIAANIRDYIDKDSTPTMLDSNGNTYSGGAPQYAVGAPGGDNEYPVVGKENVPRLQETLMRVKQYGTMGGAGASSSPYSIAISYYFEFWNPTTKDITLADLGSNPFLLVSDQATWEDASTSAGKEPPFTPPDLKIALSEFKQGDNELVFKAGDITVLTNDPTPTSLDSHYKPSDLSKVYIAAGREYTKSGTLKSINKSGYGGRPTLQLITRDSPIIQPTSGSEMDRRTEVTLGNDSGYLESHAQSIPIQPSIFVDSFSNYGAKTNTAVFHLRGGALRGNTGSAPSQFGDPVANADPLRFTAYTDSTSVSSSFINWRTINDVGESHPDLTPKITLGKYNSPYTNPTTWPEGYAKLVNTLSDGGSPYVIRNDDMVSSGELGNIYDSRRNSSDLHAPGGARTLRIGQPEQKDKLNFPVWDGNPKTVSRNRVAWRLLDIFSVNTDPSIPGLINLNGALRDGGAALQAALSGFEFLAPSLQSDSGREGQKLSKEELQQLTDSLITRLKKSDYPPLLERGELSELDFFDTGTAGGAAQNTVSDRSREEIFRRLVDLSCTRGNVFTVYAVGQAFQKQAPGKTPIIRATQTRRVTFQLIPKPVDNAPPQYTVEILSSTAL